jgi:putative spermidine/putrescine transport system permease protein
LFLFLPAGEVMLGAFKGADSSWSFESIRHILDPKQPFLEDYWITIKISLVTAAAGGVLGLLIAYAAIRQGTPRWIRTVLATFSGVAANFAGIPLAMAFVSTVGTIGIVTTFLRDHLGFDLYGHGFTLFGQLGVELTYLYFQIPLMILVIAPAIDGLRREWREAASNLGATSSQYWRRVGLPILMPSILGAMILLFGNSFSAYATAYSLTSGGAGVHLVPIEIGNYYTGNVLSNPHLSQALALGMFVVLAAMMVAYLPLQRRVSRWAR